MSPKRPEEKEESEGTPRPEQGDLLAGVSGPSGGEEEPDSVEPTPAEAPDSRAVWGEAHGEEEGATGDEVKEGSGEEVKEEAQAAETSRLEEDVGMADVPREGPAESEPPGEDEWAEGVEVGEGPAPPAGEALARAKELVLSGRVEDAVRVYREIIHENPRHVKARNNLGVLFDEAGHHELALQHLEAAREVEPRNVEVLTNLGAVLGAMGRFEGAEQELRRALRLDPGNADVRANLGILFFRRGLYEESEAELAWVCEQSPEHGPAHFYRGEALNRLGRVEAAMEVLERTVQLQPGNARAYYTLGILYDRKHMPEQARAMYRKARELGTP